MLTKRLSVTRSQTCPLTEYCNHSVKNLKRHLRQAHTLNEIQITSVLASYRQYRSRGGLTYKMKKKSICPESGCGITVLRLSDHLRRVHKTTRAHYDIGPDSESLLIPNSINLLQRQMSCAPCVRSASVDGNGHASHQPATASATTGSTASVSHVLSLGDCASTGHPSNVPK